MATYFHGNSDIQGDGLQTLILMNPGYVGYSDTHTQPPENFTNLSHAPPNQTPQLVGIPLTASFSGSASASASSSSHDPHLPSVHTQYDFSAFHGLIPRIHYNIYNSIDPTEARDMSRAKQGLSLSLSSQQRGAYGSYRDAEHEVPSQANVPTISPTSGNINVRVSDGLGSSASGISNATVSGMQSHVVLGSKYLKVAQELLDEVVRVDHEGRLKNNESAKGTMTTGKSSACAGGGATNSNGGTAAELTTAEKQEIQMKKAKLVNMLDEVEQRYKQYHHQMQIVISWFEQVSGIGSARTYTALALKTISKQFRCLKDAITSQIQAVSKSLGEEEEEEDCFGGGKIEGSRLKFVDNQLRQQRALQQLGMIQHNAWRPQRGLPERSVSVLRAWLFEHFLHPYPKDSDKLMLAKQTGLTRSQVSNWFINARVRLWKPMVEDMYMEEIKVQEQNGSEDKTSKSEHNGDSAQNFNNASSQEIENENKSYKSKQDNAKNKINTNISSISISTASTGVNINIRNQTGLALIGASEMEGIAQASPKRPRSIEMLLQSPNSASSMDMDMDMDMGVKAGQAKDEEAVSMKFGGERQSRESFTLMGSGAPTNLIGSYQIGEIRRFSAEQLPLHPSYSGNAVSLSLGLPHCENLSMSATHQTFLPNHNIQLGRGVEIGEPNEFGTINTPTSSHSKPTPTPIYENINTQNRKRFAAQLLPDFVAL